MQKELTEKLITLHDLSYVELKELIDHHSSADAE